MDPILIVYIAVSLGIPLAILLLTQPFIGLLLIIVINRFNSLIEMPIALSSGRIIGIVVAVGWFLKYICTKKSHFFESFDMNKIGIAVILSILTSSLLAGNPSTSFQHALTITLLVLMLFFIQDFIDSKGKLDLLIRTIAISVGIVSLVGILQFNFLGGEGNALGNVTAYKGESARVAGFQENPNGYGALLMSGIPLLFFLVFDTKKVLHKIFYFTLLFSSIISLFLTLSRTHIFAFAAFLLCFVVLQFAWKNMTGKQTLSLVLIIVLFFVICYAYLYDIIQDRVFGYTFSGKDTSVDARYYVLARSLSLLWQNPIFGIGFGNLELAGDASSRFHFSGVPGHDIISVFFVSSGLIGMIVFSALCYKTVRYLNQTIRTFVDLKESSLSNLAIVVKAAFLSLLFTGLGNPLVFMRMFWIYVALSVVLYRWNVKNSFAKNDPRPIERDSVIGLEQVGWRH